MIKGKNVPMNKLTIAGFIVLFVLIIYVNFFQNNDQPFLKSKWVSIQDPIYYHYFSKNKNGYIVEIHDKTGDFASKKTNGSLDGSTLIFDSVDYSKDFYTYKKGKIYVSNVSQNGIRSEFTPLERIKHGPKK